MTSSSPESERTSLTATCDHNRNDVIRGSTGGAYRDGGILPPSRGMMVLRYVKGARLSFVVLLLSNGACVVYHSPASKIASFRPRDDDL